MEFLYEMNIFVATTTERLKKLGKKLMQPQENPKTLTMQDRMDIGNPSHLFSIHNTITEAPNPRLYSGQKYTPLLKHEHSFHSLI